MRLLITTQRHADAASLIEDVRTVGTKLQAAKPVGEQWRRVGTHSSSSSSSSGRVGGEAVWGGGGGVRCCAGRPVLGPTPLPRVA
jgi:hypothetical protein